jgi:uncharacterized membrane protein
VLFVRATHLGEIGIVQPLMSAGDVVLVLLAVVFLGERLGRREWLGLAMTVVGAAGLGLGARAVPGAEFSVVDLAALLAITAIAAALLLRRARRAGPGCDSSSAAEVALAAAVGLAFGSGALLTEAWTASVVPQVAALLHPLFPALLAANIAGLVLLQVAFQRGRASVVVPVQLAVGNAVAVGGGAWLFAEALDLSRLLAVAAILLGATLLQGGGSNSFRRPAKSGSPRPLHAPP